MAAMQGRPSARTISFLVACFLLFLTVAATPVHYCESVRSETSFLFPRVSMLPPPLHAPKNNIFGDVSDKQADYAVKVREVVIKPDPVVRGKPATFSISAVTKDDIAGGKLVIDVKYFGVHIHQETHDLCDETSCPVSGGDFVISHKQVLPGFTPPGSYTLTMKLLGEGAEQLTCVSFDFKIKVGSPLADS